MLFYYLLFILLGFALGSIMFSKLIPKLVFKIDVCKNSEDHNPGSASVFKNCGTFWGLLCLFLDILKGFAPVFICVMTLSTDYFLFAFVMVAPVLGHALGLFNNFQGGKCIATIFGVTLALLPKTLLPFVTLTLFFIFFAVVVKFKSSNVRGVVVFACFGAIVGTFLCLKGQFTISAGCMALAVIAILKHSLSLIELSRCKHQDLVQDEDEVTQKQ